VTISLKTKLKSVHPGDLICCSWSDASTGRSSGSGLAIDLPVKSWGIFVGLVGHKIKHIVLAQNSYRYSDWVYDMDYIAVPVHLADDVAILIKGIVSDNDVKMHLESFSRGGERTFNLPRTYQRRIFQQRLGVNGRSN
jgi:hypothetical protein